MRRSLGELLFSASHLVSTRRGILDVSVFSADPIIAGGAMRTRLTRNRVRNLDRKHLLFAELSLIFAPHTVF